MAQVAKRMCTDDGSYISSLEDLKNMFEARMTAVETKLDLVITTCSSILMNCEKLLCSPKKDSHTCCGSELMPKMLLLENLLKKFDHIKVEPGLSAPVVLVPSSKPPSEGVPKMDPHMQIISLNNESDLPDGSWLGDETIPEERVRVNITPSVLLHINEHCSTPEKMALTLLDCLFPRDILAISNVSGRGKNCKRQLDPLLVYGIRCHLIHKFNITEQDWYRIKQNIDSKCRSVWRKKMRGLPLGTSKANNGMLSAAQVTSEDSSDGSQVLNISHSPLKVVRARGDQLVQIHDGQTIKVFADDVFKELLPSSVELFSVEDSDCFSLSDQTLIITDGSEEVCDEEPLRF